MPFTMHRESAAAPISDDRGGERRPPEPEKHKVAAARHPRWTRQETFILIQAKKVIENIGIGRGRRTSSASSTTTTSSSSPPFPPPPASDQQHEPKWDSISSYCREHGVDKSAVQCRKRWSNLVGDFRKISRWESRRREEAESFWSMRSALKREMKLPGFFDREVYNALDGKAFNVGVVPLTLFRAGADAAKIEGSMEVEEEEEEEEEEAEEAAEDGFVSDFEHSGQEGINGSPHYEKTKTQSPPMKTTSTPLSGTKQKQPVSNGCTESMPQEGHKRRRVSPRAGSGEPSLEEKLITVLERNSDMLKTQLEANNINAQLDREQRKDQIDSLVNVISKITDALVNIANKL